jgi:heme-degrading monooxygenase HmoA
MKKYRRDPDEEAVVIEIVWVFEAKAERLREFREHYKSDGEWAQLFRRAKGYMETLMLQDVANSRRFLVVDRWEGLADFEAFKQEFGAEYAAMDKRCEEFTVTEEKIGVFVSAT